MAEELTKADATRAKIVRSAAKLARRYGYNRLTLRDIADDIGIKAGSIYYHFESRDEIIRAILADGVVPAINAVRAAINALGELAPPLKKLETALRVHLKYTVSKRFASSLEGLRQLPKKLRDEHMAQERQYMTIFADLMEQIAAEGGLREGVDPKTARMLSLGALTWVSEWYRSDGPLSLDEIMDQFMMLMRGGLLEPCPAALREAPKKVVG